VSVALVIQRKKLMRRVIFPYIAYLAAPYVSTLSHKRHDFRKEKKLLDHRRCILFSVQLLSEIFIILRKN